MDVLSGQLARAIFAIRRIQRTAGFEAARVAYFALFHSRMTYALEVWGHSPHSTTILTQQKRAVRALTGASPTTHCRPLFRQHHIPTIFAVYTLLCLTALHKIKDSYPKQGDNHAYETRNRELLRGEFVRLSTMDSHANQLRIYNALPKDWKSVPTKNFKGILAAHLHETTPYTIQEVLVSLPGK